MYLFYYLVYYPLYVDVKEPARPGGLSGKSESGFSDGKRFHSHGSGV
jgi:hypothetical protein